MPGGYDEFEATSLFCPRCRKAVQVRKKLLLVLPTGTKYDYLCAECGSQVGTKIDQDPAEFRRMAPRPGQPERLATPRDLGSGRSARRRRP